MCHFQAQKWKNFPTEQALTFFFFGDHPNFRLCFRICTLGSTIKSATAPHRPAFVGVLIEMFINLVKSVVFHRSKKRDLRSKKRDKASKSGTVPPKAGRMVTLDIYQLELAKFMYQLHHNQLPKNFYHSFHEINTIYQHETRLINLTAYCRPRINKLFCQKLFSHRGSKLWGYLESELKSMH